MLKARLTCTRTQSSKLVTLKLQYGLPWAIQSVPQPCWWYSVEWGIHTILNRTYKLVSLVLAHCPLPLSFSLRRPGSFFGSVSIILCVTSFKCCLFSPAFPRAECMFWISGFQCEIFSKTFEINCQPSMPLFVRLLKPTSHKHWFWILSVQLPHCQTNFPNAYSLKYQAIWLTQQSPEHKDVTFGAILYHLSKTEEEST